MDFLSDLAKANPLVLTLILLIAVALSAPGWIALLRDIQRGRQERARNQDQTKAEIVTAPIEADKRSDDMLKSVIQGWDRTITKIDRNSDAIERLADEMHDKNVNDAKALAQTAQQMSDSREGLHELRDDLSLTTNALNDHAKATAPAVAAIIEQKPVLAGIDQKIGTLPGAVRTEMREDFQALQMLFEGLKLQVTGVEQQAFGAHHKLDIIIQALQSMADRAPSTPQPASLPEITTKLEVTAPVEVEADPTRPGIKSPFDNGQPASEVTT